MVKVSCACLLPLSAVYPSRNRRSLSLLWGRSQPLTFRPAGFARLCVSCTTEVSTRTSHFLSGSSVQVSPRQIPSFLFCQHFPTICLIGRMWGNLISKLTNAVVDRRAQEPKLLGTTENALGLRPYCEKHGYELIVTSDKEGPNSVFQKNIVDAE